MKKITELLIQAKKNSTCHNAHIAAIIETADGRYISGWNGPPAAAGSHSECLLRGPITPENIRQCPGVHAEVRAICRAARQGIPIAGAALYLSEWYPCAPCAITMIEAGIRKLILTEELNFAKDDCYNFHLAQEYLEKAGVVVEIRKDLFE